MRHEIKVPEAGFNVTEATVGKWLKNVGEAIAKDEIVVSVETDKITVEVPAGGSGFLVEIRFSEGQKAQVGEVLGVISDTKEAAQAGAPGRKFDHKRKISPTAKAVARAQGVDLSLIATGSGPGGRIVKKDVLAFIAAREQAPAPVEKKAAEPGIIRDEARKIRFEGWRKVIADRMTASKQQVPHYNNAMDIDVTDLARLIAAKNKEKDHPRLTYIPFIMKALVAGIDLVPEVNALCYEDGFIIQDTINAGVAVDLGEKLLVPVVKNIREKSILQLAAETREVVVKARDEKLTPKDIMDGTITITNAGVYGILYGTPIIFQPQTTIVSLGAVKEVPSIVDGQIVPRKKMIIVCSFDHRAVHGGPGARFLREVQRNLEDLTTLMLGL